MGVQDLSVINFLISKFLKMRISEKLSALRAAMKARKIDAYIIPSGDPHQSEYMAGHWKSREWISGFTGSVGTVVVTCRSCRPMGRQPLLYPSSGAIERQWRGTAQTQHPAHPAAPGTG